VGSDKEKGGFLDHVKNVQASAEDSDPTVALLEHQLAVTEKYEGILLKGKPTYKIPTYGQTTSILKMRAEYGTPEYKRYSAFDFDFLSYGKCPVGKVKFEAKKVASDLLGCHEKYIGKVQMVVSAALGTISKDNFAPNATGKTEGLTARRNTKIDQLRQLYSCCAILLPFVFIFPLTK
jgi:hypothetical protein